MAAYFSLQTKFGFLCYRTTHCAQVANLALLCAQWSCEARGLCDLSVICIRTLEYLACFHVSSDTVDSVKQAELRKVLS
jgi:hypothetical protein